MLVHVLSLLGFCPHVCLYVSVCVHMYRGDHCACSYSSLSEQHSILYVQDQFAAFSRLQRKIDQLAKEEKAVGSFIH